MQAVLFRQMPCRRQDAGAAVIVATPYRDRQDIERARATLAGFLAASKPALDAMLDQPR